ncbi:hypothetical protein D9M71_333470 [compost metagenome]
MLPFHDKPDCRGLVFDRGADGGDLTTVTIQVGLAIFLIIGELLVQVAVYAHLPFASDVVADVVVGVELTAGAIVGFGVLAIDHVDELGADLQILQRISGK